jgi:hypothetical protein
MYFELHPALAIQYRVVISVNNSKQVFEHTATQHTLAGDGPTDREKHAVRCASLECATTEALHDYAICNNDFARRS